MQRVIEFITAAKTARHLERELEQTIQEWNDETLRLLSRIDDLSFDNRALREENASLRIRIAAQPMRGTDGRFHSVKAPA